LKDKLEIWPVYKVGSTGKLVARVSNSHLFQELNSDLSFSSRQVHGIKRTTACTPTPYRIEVEYIYGADGFRYRPLRSWNEISLSKRLSPENKLLEGQINVSPSSHLNEFERLYVGEKDGTANAKSVFGWCAAFAIASLLFFQLPFYPAVVWLSVGSLIVTFVTYYFSTSAPDPAKFESVLEAKERIRNSRIDFLQEELGELDSWSRMTGIEFEKAVKFVFEQRGYEANLTAKSYDKGVDIILKRATKTIIVQCKAYNKPVGVSAVRTLRHC
jgi:Restriction endonuclease